jgi:aminoglycoside phosphotransferase (APT) family kinase protein
MHSVSPNDVESYLRSRSFASDDMKITRLERISGGFSRATWIMDTRCSEWGARTFIVRQQLRGGIVEGIAADVKHEYPLLQVLHSEGMPVPRPLVYCTGANPFGHDFMMVERLPGRTAGTAIGESAVAGERFLQDVARTLARLHSIDWTRHRAALCGSRVWHPSPTASRAALVRELIDRWYVFVANNIGILSPAVETCFAWLHAHAPESDDRPRIVHGDVTFANMLEHEGRLTALLDWEVACLGDPAKDVAHIKPVVERRVPWARFMHWYQAAGGQSIDAETLLFYEIFKAVTHTAVTFVARGRRFADAPEIRPELTEIGLNQPAVYLQDLLSAMNSVK